MLCITSYLSLVTGASSLHPLNDWTQADTSRQAERETERVEKNKK